MTTTTAKDGNGFYFVRAGCARSSTVDSELFYSNQRILQKYSTSSYSVQKTPFAEVTRTLELLLLVK